MHRSIFAVLLSVSLAIGSPAADPCATLEIDTAEGIFDENLMKRTCGDVSGLNQLYLTTCIANLSL
jgi:hypothetical protein